MNHGSQDANNVRTHIVYSYDTRDTEAVVKPHFIITGLYPPKESRAQMDVASAKGKTVHLSYLSVCGGFKGIEAIKLLILGAQT
jgi:hypothetical protein